jgi:hypothetical protein
MLLIPDLALLDRQSTTFASFTALTSTTHKLTFVGVIKQAGTISTIGFRLGTVTKGVGGTTTLTVSLQDQSATTGRPDGSIDQSGTVTGAALASNQWVNVTLGSQRAVSVGDRVCVVFEITTIEAGDSIAISGFTSAGLQCLSFGVHYDGTTWATPASAAPNVVFGYSDPPGTSASFLATLTASAITSHAYNVGTTGADERGIQWIPALSAKVYGIMAVMNAANDFEAILYEGTTVLAKFTSIGVMAKINGKLVFCMPFSAPVNVVAGTTYYITIRPTSSNNITVVSYSLDNAQHRAAWPMETEIAGADRLNQGATWNVTQTQVYPIVPIIDPTAVAAVAIPVVRFT